MENKTKLETIFDMFCDKEIEGKNRHFFHYKKNIFATNGISMIYCDESYLDFKTYNIILKEFILDNFLNIKILNIIRLLLSQEIGFYQISYSSFFYNDLYNN